MMIDTILSSKEKGNDAFKAKNFTAAIEYFTEAINALNGNNTIVLLALTAFFTFTHSQFVAGIH